MDKRLKHGHSYAAGRSPTYRSWHAMKQRALNPKDPNAKHYSERGITVCERWLDFKNFLADMGERPEGTSLDRIDNSKGYEPGNCRWVSQKEQMRNRRTNVFIEHNGKRQTVREWSIELGISFTTLRTRMKAGWPTHRVLSTSRFAKNQFTT
jgi:hypothetical protein